MSELKSEETLGLGVIAAAVFVVALIAWGAFSWFNKGSYEECYIKQINSAKTAQQAQYIRRSAEQLCAKKYPTIPDPNDPFKNVPMAKP